MHSVHARVIVVSLRLDGTKHFWRSSSDIRKPGRLRNLSLRTRWNHGQHAQIRPELQQASLWRLTRRDLRASNTDLRSWTYRLNQQQQPRAIHTVWLYVLGHTLIWCCILWKRHVYSCKFRFACWRFVSWASFGLFSIDSVCKKIWSIVPYPEGTVFDCCKVY